MREIDAQTSMLIELGIRRDGKCVFEKDHVPVDRIFHKLITVAIGGGVDVEYSRSVPAFKILEFVPGHVAPQMHVGIDSRRVFSSRL